MSVGCVKVLLEFGSRVYDSDEWGVFPIHVCVGAYGDFDDSLAILDILLEAGSADDIFLKDGYYEKSTLHYAAFHGNRKMCERLLELGVDIDMQDKNGRTAYQSCERQPKIQRFLREKGCVLPSPPVKKKFLPPLFPLRQNNCNVVVVDGADGDGPTGDLRVADKENKTLSGKDISGITTSADTAVTEVVLNTPPSSSSSSELNPLVQPPHSPQVG